MVAAPYRRALRPRCTAEQPWQAGRVVGAARSGARLGYSSATMFLKALLALLLLPGIVAGILPWQIIAHDPYRSPDWQPALGLTGVGLVILLWCVRDFYVVGKGTLAPWSPPQHLVVVGLYRWIRNPMYAGVVLIVLGAGLAFGSIFTIAYAVAIANVPHWP